jgi:hypothetical protein
MKINIPVLVFLISFLVSFSIQKYENNYYRKFLSKSNNKNEMIEKFLSEEEPKKNLIEEKEVKKIEEMNRYEEGFEKSFAESTDENRDENKDRTYVNVKCLFVAKYNVYSLQKLIKPDGYQFKTKKGEMQFNFCQDLNGYDSTAVLHNNETNETVTVLYSGSIDGNSKSKNEWLEMDEDDGTKGVKIRLAEGDTCTEKLSHLTILRIYCDENVDEINLDYSEFNVESCTHYINGRSIYGCALNDWYLLRRLMKEYNYIFATLLIIVGLFLAAFGKRFEIPTILIISGFFVCYLISVIILSFIPSIISTERNLWIMLTVTFVIGAIIGFLLRKQVTVFAVLLGACSGYSIAEFVYQFISGFMTTNPTVLYWVVVGICSLLGGVFGYFAVQVVVILGTAIIGGYIVMRGFTLIFDNYMELAEFADLAKSGEIEQLKDIKNGWVYAYLGLWLVISIGGIYYQCIGYKKEKAKEAKEGKKHNKK